MAKDTIERSYIRVREPWHGGHTPFDTGFGNRLLHWDACYMLEYCSSTDHFLELQTQYWYEMKYLDLPGIRTRKLEYEVEDATAWLAEFDINFADKEITHLPILNNELVDIFLEMEAPEDIPNYDLPEPRYCAAFEWDKVNLILNKAKELKIPSGLKRIKVKDHTLRSAIRQIATGCVGLHIRRGNGVYKSEKNYKELPASVRENDQYTQVDGTIYKYWDDNKFSGIIKEILEYSPNQKFYISCDLLEKEYEYLKDKFNARIFTRRDVIDSLPGYLTADVNFNDVRCVNRIALESVIDMMCLASSNFIVGAPHSTWLDSIQRMKNVPYSYINEPKDTIITEYVKSLQTYSTLV